MLSLEITEAENRLPELIERCIRGEEILIHRSGKFVKLVSFTRQKRKQRSAEMVYKDYLNAALKHKITCEVIAEKLNEKDNQKDPNRKSLTLNLYYLSGYMIECMVKYAIYDLIGYRKGDDVRDLNERELTYDAHIRHHRFERYTEHLLRRMSGRIPLINDTKGIPKEIVNIYKEWDAEIRYSYELKYNRIYYVAFYEYAKEIFGIIKDNTRG